MNLLQQLRVEFERRQQRNPRYSLRAFARDLGTDHSTLSQILRKRRQLSARMVRRFGGRLGLSPNEVVDASVHQHAAAILRLAQLPAFQADSRWIAMRTGIPLDCVNVALHRLLHRGELRMETRHHWSTSPASQSYV